MRQAARIALGIGEATSEIKSLDLLESLVLDPLAAKVQHDRQKAEAQFNEQRRTQTQTQNGAFD